MIHTYIIVILNIHSTKFLFCFLCKTNLNKFIICLLIISPLGCFFLYILNIGKHFSFIFHFTRRNSVFISCILHIIIIIIITLLTGLTGFWITIFVFVFFLLALMHVIRPCAQVLAGVVA